jgi:hypothetical protein
MLHVMGLRNNFWVCEYPEARCWLVMDTLEQIGWLHVQRKGRESHHEEIIKDPGTCAG